MNTNIIKLKPDFEIAAKRMEAYWKGEILDRPILLAETSKENYDFTPRITYYERAVSGDLRETLNKILHNARGLNYLGESMPSAWMSFGTHEIASFFGANIKWTDGSGDTTWADPIVDDWNKFLPLEFDENNPNWQRILEFYRLSADIFQGEVLPISLDFHSNMDLLLSLRGDEALCLDLYDCPELIEKAMEGARTTFKRLWESVEKAGDMKTNGYWFDGYSNKPVCVLACDFICMIGTEMLRRYFIPTFEYEASFIDHVIFHWDGPGALKHFDDIVSLEKLHTVSYVPNVYERHTQFLDMYKEIQKRGKSVCFTGTPEEIKSAFKELSYSKTMYKVQVSNEKEFYDLEKWIKNNM